MKMIPVAFGTDDWEKFATLLEESVPEEYGFDFGIGPDALLFHWFCNFIHKIERAWTLRSQLYGPGYQCLRVNRQRLLNCVGITAVHAYNNTKENFYRWLRWPTLLARAGYDVKIEVENPGFVPNEDLVRNATHGLVELDVKVVELPRYLRKGLTGHGRGGEARSCEGELACVWTNGKYYPCWHCVGGGMRWPVYGYGELGEPFERKGKEGCRLVDCPISV